MPAVCLWLRRVVCPPFCSLRIAPPVRVADPVHLLMRVSLHGETCEFAVDQKEDLGALWRRITLYATEPGLLGPDVSLEYIDPHGMTQPLRTESDWWSAKGDHLAAHTLHTVPLNVCVRDPASKALLAEVQAEVLRECLWFRRYR